MTISLFKETKAMMMGAGAFFGFLILGLIVGAILMFLVAKGILPLFEVCT
ncbi:MAG: hypothetical protein ACQESC_01615 [Nanobdellota archaeon]